MNHDTAVLRSLAYAYREAAMAPRNAERLQLHKAVNDLRMIRPVVLMDELPWHELNGSGELTLQCEDPYLRSVEQQLRRQLFKFRHMPADMYLPPWIPVGKVVGQTGNGVDVKEELRYTDIANNIVSHEYHDQFAEDSDIAKLKDVVVTYDEAETMRRWNLLGSIVADILPVRLTGIGMLYVTTWDQISMYRGVTPLLYDLVDRPEFSHALAERLTQIYESTLMQYEALGLLDDWADSLHCTCYATDDMPHDEREAGKPLTRRSVWGRGTAQIFASVSPAMHDEFDIEYMKRTIGTCGMSYYGCCEPLDRKMDIVEHLPNLRKVGLTPWADPDVMCERVGKRFVVSNKPNPASVGASVLDRDALKKELGRILGACRRYGCSMDITLKDISTCACRPENLFEWEQTVMDMVLNF